MRFVTAAILVIGFAVPAHAAEDGEGWTFSGRLTGTSNPSGLVLRADPSVGYSFNRYVSSYAGLPFYFVNPSTSQTASGFVNGIGNAYAGIRLGIDSSLVDYASNLVVSVPTGDRSTGFSTGRVTADWTNDFSRRFEAYRPFASIGVANTISDTSFFVRPFSSVGLVTHFDAGTTVDLTPNAHLGGSGYGIRAAGDQRIASKTSGRGRGPADRFQETVGPAEIANDYGFSTWLGVNPQSNSNFYFGYSRSVTYDVNSFFFGVGFRVGR